MISPFNCKRLAISSFDYQMSEIRSLKVNLQSLVNRVDCKGPEIDLSEIILFNFSFIKSLSLVV